jgi:hypothetical protein
MFLTTWLYQAVDGFKMNSKTHLQNMFSVFWPVSSAFDLKFAKNADKLFLKNAIWVQKTQNLMLISNPLKKTRTKVISEK